MTASSATTAVRAAASRATGEARAALWRAASRTATAAAQKAASATADSSGRTRAGRQRDDPDEPADDRCTEHDRRRPAEAEQGHEPRGGGPGREPEVESGRPGTQRRLIAHTVTSGRRSANFASPMPLTCRNCSTVSKRP